MSDVRPAVLTAAAGVLAVLALGGCSGGSGGGGAGASTLSKAQLDAQADAICTAEKTAGEAVPQPHDSTDPTQAAAYFDKIDRIIARTTTKLEALRPDSSVAASWQAFLTERRAFSSALHDIREQADAGDKSAVSQLENLSLDKLASAAAAVGATSCGETS